MAADVALSLDLEKTRFFVHEIAVFIETNLNFLNCHMVDFITKDLWTSLISDGLKCELELLGLNITNRGEQPIFSMLFNCERFEAYPNLSTLISKVNSLLLDKISNPLENLPNHSEALSYLDSWWMSWKKTHEVDAFAQLVSSEANSCQTNSVVDFGSGKGYLSTLLSLKYNLHVFGLDCSKSNAHSAEKRHEKIAKAYQKQDIQQDSSNENRTGQFWSVAEIVDDSTDLYPILQQANVTAAKERRLIFCGLHTCGDLGATVVRQFVQNRKAHRLCYVGCCYHLIQEEFTQNPFPSEQPTITDSWGFPLSSFLRSQKCRLGRNARMLASQSWDKITSSSEQAPNRSLFYRAVLQAILKDMDLTPNSDFRVGRIASKCQNFAQYFNKALGKLKLENIKMTDEEIECRYKKYAHWESKLCIFQCLRILLAPTVEAIVILDRALFLLEQESVEDCKLLQVFDPKISPRCYAITACKKKMHVRA